MGSGVARMVRACVAATGTATVALFLPIGGCLSSGGCLASSAAPLPPRHGLGSSMLLAGHALLYSRERDGVVEVCWHAPGAREPAVLYRTRPGNLWPWIPAKFGYAPSPDGRWLLAWEVVEAPLHSPKQANSTIWSAVPIAGGRAVRIGKEAGTPFLLPYWLSYDRALLEGDTVLGGEGEVTVFDVNARRLSRRLPRPLRVRATSLWFAARADEVRLVAYVQHHYSSALELFGGALDVSHLSSDLARLSMLVSSPPDRSDWDPPEYFLLRSLGLPLAEPPGGFQARHMMYPSVAVDLPRRRLGLAFVAEQPATPEPAPGVAGPAAGYAAAISVVEMDSPVPRAETRRVSLAPWRGQWDLGSGRLAVPVPHYDPSHIQIYFGDLRWSCDGAYLSFTRYATPGAARQWGIPETTVLVFDAESWQEVAAVYGGSNAFVVPVHSVPEP
jgi:hypothetical protein